MTNRRDETDEFAARTEGNRIVANIIHNLERQLAEAQAERDAARKVVDAVTARYWECPGAVVEAWHNTRPGAPETYFNGRRAWPSVARQSVRMDNDGTKEKVTRDGRAPRSTP